MLCLSFKLKIVKIFMAEYRSVPANLSLSLPLLIYRHSKRPQKLPLAYETSKIQLKLIKAHISNRITNVNNSRICSIFQGLKLIRECKSEMDRQSERVCV